MFYSKLVCHPKLLGATHVKLTILGYEISPKHAPQKNLGGPTDHHPFLEIVWGNPSVTWMPPPADGYLPIPDVSTTADQTHQPVIVSP